MAPCVLIFLERDPAMNEIIWYQLPNESHADRIDRLNEALHRIFFDGKEICPEKSLQSYANGDLLCRLCDGYTLFPREEPIKHGTPRFLESLDAMQRVVESGRFAEVREEYAHWVTSGNKYECRIFLYGKGVGNYFFAEGNSRQEAFYLAALASQDYEVVREEQGRQ